MRKFLSATMLATSLIVAGGAFTRPGLCRGRLQPRQLRRARNRSIRTRPRLSTRHISCATCSRVWSCRTQKANLIPGAAESWTVSDDGTVYTFKLRKDGVWSDGSPVTADDFVYSFRRLEDPATGRRIRLDALSS